MGESLEPNSSSGIRQNESMERPSQYVKYLRENGFPKLKDLQLTIFLGPHVTSAHADDIAAHFKDIDVFIPEFANAEPKAEVMLRGVSSGSVPPAAMPPTTWPKFFERLFSLIDGKHLHVAIVDAPIGSREAKVFNDAFTEWIYFLRDMIKNKWSPNVAPSIYCHRFEAYVRSSEVRERYTAENICPAIVRSYVEDEQKQHLELLRVLIFMGSAHEILYDIVKNEHSQTIKLGTRAPDTYSGEVAFKIRSGGSAKSIARELQIKLLSEALVGQLLSSRMGRLGWTEAVQAKYVYDCVTRMTQQEHERLYSLCTRKDPANASEFLKQILIRESTSLESD